MKFGLTIVLCMAMSCIAFSQSPDSVIFQTQSFKLTQNLDTRLYTVVANQTHDGLLFVRRIVNCFQILDENLGVYYIDIDGKKTESVWDYYVVCGTVPHYELSIKSSNSFFEIYEDETFFDHENEIAAHRIDMISKQEADSVFFINGKTKFQFDENFSIGINTTNPGTLILFKDGQCFTKDSPDVKYDSIDFSGYHNSLKTKRSGLYGVLGVVEPKFRRIEDFVYYLAKAETENGEVVYIDIDGNEYMLAGKKGRKRH